jgi:hypothetical protein
MNSKLINSLLISIAIVVLGLLGACHGAKLRQKYYEYTCPHVLDIVREVTWKHVAQDLTLAAPLLRLHFHDCFVRVIHLCFLLYICALVLNLYFLICLMIITAYKLINIVVCLSFHP